MSDLLPKGIYENLLTSELQRRLDNLDAKNHIARISEIDPSLAGDFLTRSLSEHIQRALKTLGKGKDSKNIYLLANRILQTIGEYDDSLSFLQDLTYQNTADNLLTEIHSIGESNIERPSTPLTFPSLFTGASGSPQLGKELELELESADRVDLLVSFIKSAGINLLYPSLDRFTARGGKLRVITTTYLGASDPAAIQKLAQLPNTEIKISYDTKHSRLHAKAYFIHRNSGLSCAYIGSANLSHAAMTSGLEWTVKLPKPELPDLFRRCEAQFESYWEAASFSSYSEGDFEYLVKSTKSERYTPSEGINLTPFELRPHEHQKIVLSELHEAREDREHFRNLVVAATGTGKTMIAAFDYKRLPLQSGKRPKLLFLAHRKEILRQARDSFRHVLSDGNFGDELYGGKVPENYDHLFCSVSSFNSRQLTSRFSEDHWDIVILDEAHHGKAASYKEILTKLSPKILLGLTATPERTDGSSIAEDFDTPLASEIRLPDALEQKLLCPFHYYAVSDHTVDFSRLSWRQGKYDSAELSKIITGNRARIELIIKKIVEYFPAPLDPNDFDREQVKAIGFCVSQEHAHELANEFNSANIPAIALDANTPAEVRDNARHRLTNGEINFIFTVDLFNEGIDIPAVNGILFLRPTESHVIYQQQLGRGLRNYDDKDQLIVLDFVGAAHKNFRFDLRLKSLLPGKRHNLKKEITQGFPHLPAGCYISFEKTAKETILNNIRQTYKNIDNRIIDAFSAYSTPPSLTEFIQATKESPAELLTKRSWSSWKELAKLTTVPFYEGKSPELNSLARASMTNDPEYLNFLIRLIEADETSLKQLLIGSKYTASAYYLLWNKKGADLGFKSYLQAFKQLRSNLRYSSDLLEILGYARTQQLPTKLEKPPETHRLRLHANYTMREVTAAFGKADVVTSGPTGTGVVHIEDSKTYLHFVTFEKNEKLFSESTMYRDYLSSRTTLHWESQSSTSQHSPTGQNYIHQKRRGYTILVLARIRKTEGKLTSPFTFLGSTQFISAHGDRPISIIYELDSPVSHNFFHEAKIATGLS